MILFPPAKVNIGLNILYKRNDGFHELETIMSPIRLYDVIEILPSSSFEWKQTGLQIDGDFKENLCYKAFQMMKQEYGIENVYMHLRKQIPFGAGLGGGSSDAAYVIKGLNQLFDLQLPVDTQKEIASKLGSDCPFFIENKVQFATGRGELLKSIDLNFEQYHFVVIKPNIHISTKEAYSNVFIGGEKDLLNQCLNFPLALWKEKITNDFEVEILKKYPLLSTIKQILYDKGAIYTSMSGSGSAMYGIFEKKIDDLEIDDLEIYWC